jgi:hypothetical protein
MMTYRRRSPLTPGARCILVYLTESTEPQTLLNIADGAHLSYFHTRKLCQSLHRMGLVELSAEGRQPRFSFCRPADTTSTTESSVPAVL